MVQFHDSRGRLLQRVNSAVENDEEMQALLHRGPASKGAAAAAIHVTTTPNSTFSVLPQHTTVSNGKLAYSFNVSHVPRSRRNFLLFRPLRLLLSPLRPLLVIFSNHHVALHCFTCALLLAYLASQVSYLSYKLNLYFTHLDETLTNPWLMAVLACEVLYFFSGIISAIDYVTPPPTKPPPPSLEMLLSNGGDEKVSSSQYPTVDIFIPCCKEPTEVPQESVLAALAMDYPKDRFRVVVLDDGGDDNLKAFCEAMQVESGGEQLRYLRRKKIPGVPHNFKCGNMNYGLENSTAEFVVMMDADMVLHPSFFRRLLPHLLASPNVAFVQIPQSFYNLPIGDPLNDACGFGYDRVMVHRNTLGSANCVGTGAIFRRKHLDDIGGFQPQSITEDTMTAYVLFNRGYKSVYVNEKLQVGLVPWSFEAFVKQRQRWGQGAIQQFLTTWRTMLGRRSRLNMIQKACYFWHTGYYYMSILNVVLLFVLWAALAFRLNLLVGSEEENRGLMARLAIYLVLWRMFWYSLWVEVPQPMQSRNRDESMFWWMTPFFFNMVTEAAFNYRSTFKFVPTSNIDRRAADGKAKHSAFRKKLNDLKHVKPHVFVCVVGMVTILVRSYIAFFGYGVNDCRHRFQVIGLSVFLFSVCAHMFVPVLHILCPTGYKPEQRKSLLKYNANGVPTFNPSETGPKWHPIIIFYEFLSYAQLAFWITIFWAVKSGYYDEFCNASMFN